MDAIAAIIDAFADAFFYYIALAAILSTVVGMIFVGLIYWFLIRGGKA